MPQPDVFVGNHHSAAIVLRRPMIGGKSLISTVVFPPDITIWPGTVEPVPRDIWEMHKKTPLIKAYLDKGILTTERKEKDVSIGFDSADSDPPIPEHLQEEEFHGNEAPGKAKVVRAKPGVIRV